MEFNSAFKGLRCCATKRMVAGSIPADVIGIYELPCTCLQSAQVSLVLLLIDYISKTTCFNQTLSTADQLVS